MFDIGFSELLVIAIVALIVLGPERLPKAARFAGLWVRRARAQWYSVKDELERELAADELKRNLQDAKDAMRETEQRIRDSVRETEQQFEEVRQAARDDAKALHDDVASAITPPALARPPAATGEVPDAADTPAGTDATDTPETGTTPDLFPPRETR